MDMDMDLHSGPSKPPPAAFSSSIPPNHHRRAHSEVSFRVLQGMDLSSDPFAGSSAEEIGSEDDLFNTYIDVDKLAHSNSNSNGGSDLRASPATANGVGFAADAGVRPRHRHSYSVDASSSGFGGAVGTVFGEIIDAKKAMPPDKLAELWTVDPKRAKRILANRQSASLSKERKARYMQELERKVQILQTEATTLSAQLTLYQRDTGGLKTENSELILWLQAMEQQAQLRDALSDALKQEVERLRIATGETASFSESFNLGMHSTPYNNNISGYHYPSPQQPTSAAQHNMQLPAYHPHPSQASSMMHHLHPPSSQQASDYLLQNDPLGLGRLQGLDISSNCGGSLTPTPTVKSEGPSMSACESSSSF